MHGWKLADDPIESGGVVDRDRLQETSQLLVLPLVKSDARQLKLRFVAQRIETAGETNWPLPEPQGAFVLPGDLDVVAQSSLLVTPQIEKLVGTAPRFSTPADEVAARRPQHQRPHLERAGPFPHLPPASGISRHHRRAGAGSCRLGRHGRADCPGADRGVADVQPTRSTINRPSSWCFMSPRCCGTIRRSL